MKVYIVVYQPNAIPYHIESVWSTRELAQSARHYHANMATKTYDDYVIVEREINKATGECASEVQ